MKRIIVYKKAWGENGSEVKLFKDPLRALNSRNFHMQSDLSRGTATKKKKKNKHKQHASLAPVAGARQIAGMYNRAALAPPPPHTRILEIETFGGQDGPITILPNVLRRSQNLHGSQSLSVGFFVNRSHGPLVS
jgi:hypothetical protein